MPPEAPARPRWGGANGALILATAPVIGLVGGYLGAEIALAPLRDALATRPPIVIAVFRTAAEPGVRVFWASAGRSPRSPSRT